MVSGPGQSEKGGDVSTLLLRSHNTHPQLELDDVTLDGRRQNVKLQAVRAEGNGHCSGTRRKFCEGGGQYRMGRFGGRFGLELHHCLGVVGRRRNSDVDNENDDENDIY